MLQPLEAAGIHGRKIRARMKKVIAASLSGLLTAYVLAIFLPINPDEARPGARLSGEVAEGDVDWSFIQGVTLVIVQTKTWHLIPHSVTVTSWVTDATTTWDAGSAPRRFGRHISPATLKWW